VICACHNVAVNEITGVFASGGTVNDAQQKLKCGTGCGSCLPEIKRIESSTRVKLATNKLVFEELTA
jgi:assimilatory nitrate reductase catalytic subunit